MVVQRTNGQKPRQTESAIAFPTQFKSPEKKFPRPNGFSRRTRLSQTKSCLLSWLLGFFLRGGAVGPGRTPPLRARCVLQCSDFAALAAHWHEKCALNPPPVASNATHSLTGQANIPFCGSQWGPRCVPGVSSWAPLEGHWPQCMIHGCDRSSAPFEMVHHISSTVAHGGCTVIK
jgi:hypothetical protein